jgi:homocysteine S-methyltransferase
MNPLAKILQQQKVLVLDGALATELERAGADLHDPLWSAKVLLEQPELIKKVHADYFAAGADCVITASYQASFEGFARRGLSRAQAAELMRLSVRLAVEARDEFWAEPDHRIKRLQPLVAASVGPYGAYLADGSEYRGNYGLTETESIDFHRPRLSVLAETEADLLACESIPSFVEARALTHLLGEFPQRLAWISFTAKDESHISEGIPLVDCIQWLNDYPQIIAIGVNCTAPHYIPALIKAARGATDKAIVVYPNSGEGYSREDRVWLGEGGLGQYGQQAWDWYQCGANIIGGCCRTTPAEIRQVAAWVRDAPETVV